MEVARKKRHNKNLVGKSAESDRAYEKRVDNQTPHARIQEGFGSFYSAGPIHPLQSIQAKYTVGAVNDPHERDADAVADQVMRGEAAAPVSPLENSNRTSVSNGTEYHTDEFEHSNDGESLQYGTTTTSLDFNNRLERLRGRGRPIPGEIRDKLGNRMGRDFRHVGVHTGDEANALNRKINARAFTVGNDVFFSDNQYAPHSHSGQRLLAHELAHVSQQSGINSTTIQRNGHGTAGAPASPTTPSGAPPSSENEFTLSDGTFIEREQRIYPGSDTPKKRITLPMISLPDFKVRNESRFPHSLSVRPPGSRNTNQGEVWRESVRSSVQRILDTKKSEARTSGGFERNSETYFFKSTQNDDFILIGRDASSGDESTSLIESFMVPFWDEDGTSTSFQIDHVVEDQLFNEQDLTMMTLDTTDKASNFELLEAGANQSSGGRISHQIRRRMRAAIDLFATEHPNEPPLTLDGLRHGYFVNFSSRSFDLGGVTGRPDAFWPNRSIRQGLHLNQIQPLTGDEMRALNREDEPVIFPSPRGGTPKYVQQSQLPIRNWLPRVDLQEVEITENPSAATVAGWITVNAYNADDARAGFVSASYPDMRWRLMPVPGMYGGAIDAQYVKDNYFGARASLNLAGLSPIEFDEFSISDGGVRAEGRVLPTVPIIGDADIRILVVGGEIQLRKTFSGGEINIPSPFEIHDTSLTIFVGTSSGLGVEGELNFAIQNVGEGFIGATASTSGGFELEGQFDFDERIFGEGTRAQARVGYRNNQWSVGGTLTIPRGKVPGVSSATINVDYSEASGFSATGEAELDVPGVESGTISITQNEEEGFVIGGSFTLSGDTPGIRGGRISAELREKEDGSGFAISATGEAQPDIPGINSNLRVSYNDGAFTAEIEAEYARGMLSGRVNAGVTNRTVGEDGQLSETAEPDNPLIVYGGGELTIRIAPWLEGTAGVQFAPNGEITVTGRIGIPDELEIFPRREVNRSIFNIAVQVPIIPGIVAEIGGGLGATAGFGPGVINQLELGITYNPDHEEDTTISGDVNFRVPADAGLRLSVRAGIGLGITGASATGGLDIGGTLGIEGAAEAGAHVEWSPSRGLDLRANVRVSAQPVFIFDIGGYVRVTALGIALYDERFVFQEFRFGSDYTFGIRLPIHYQEGQPFDISLDDVEFEVPDIDTNQLLRGLIERVT
ncbi:MAG: DUF4157 domain-containing protein [Gammaproteobacteria bacterium]|nr:DUF4157 domain-containing protein [Gammaproteobacteria bacterium]